MRADKSGPHRVAFEKNKKRILKTETICGICGKPVNKKLKYPDLMSAVIDHIIPVSKGGIAVTKDDLLIKKEETEHRIQNLVDISRNVRMEIFDCLETLDDYRFSEVLESYFIDGYTLEAIAENKNYSIQHVGYLYGKGLEMVQIVENDKKNVR